MNDHLSAECLHDFLEGSLPNSGLESVEKHLEHCSHCQELLAKLADDPITKHWHSLLDQSRELEQVAEGLSHEQLNSKLSSGLLDSSSDAVQPHPPTAPGYTILGEIGRGGMGVVYRAMHRDLNRLVALKMILSGRHASEAESSRFRREAETLARLRHPNIVQVFDVGVAEGCVYIAMELVDGPTLAQLIRDKPQPARVAAGIVETLAFAIQHAHEQGVIHRDLKPANILMSGEITSSEGFDTPLLPHSTPKIADFGLAKRPNEGGDRTQTREFMGTPSYMAPEQATGGSSITTAVDIHSLGGILYELLTGRPPFQGESSIETIFHVVHDDPVPPSQLRLGLPRDLETICLKCLQKEPRRRFASAADLAADLHRFLEGKPIKARPTPSWERAWKWARRHPAVAGLSLILILVTALTFGMLLDRSRQATANAIFDKKAREVETKARLETERLLAGSFLDQGINLCETDNLSTGMLWMVRSLELAESLGDENLTHAIRANLAAWSQRLVHLRHALPGREWVTSVAFSPDGKLALTGTRDKTACLWDVATGEMIGEPMVHRYAVWSVAFSPDGGTILTGSGEDDPFYSDHGNWTIALHSAGTWFSDDRKSAQPSGEARLWDVATRKMLGAPLVHTGSVSVVQWSKDGSKLLTVGSGKAMVWSGVRDAVPSSTKLPHPDGALAATFDPRGTIVVTGGSDGFARQWDAVTGQPVGLPMQHPGPVNLTVFQPRGRVLLTGSIRRDVSSGKATGGEARLWNIDTSQALGPSIPHRGPLKGGAFSDDGQIVVTGGFALSGQSLNDSSGEARTWDTFDGQLIGPVLEHPQVVTAVAISSNGRLVTTGCRDSLVRFWMPRNGKALTRAESASSSFNYGTVSGLAFSPDGKMILAANLTEIPCGQLFDVPSALELAVPLRHKGAVNTSVFSPDGRSILTGSRDRTARIWDALSGRPIGMPLEHPDSVTLIAYHPEGRMLATGCGAIGTLQLWDAATLQPTGQPPTRSRELMGLTFSRDGKDLLFDYNGESIHICDPVTGQIRYAWDHPWRSTQATLSPDGRTLLTGSMDGFARLWEPGTGTLLKKWRHFPSVGGVAFSPDGKVIALGGRGNAAQMWSLDGEPIGPPLVHRGEVTRLAFSPDGRLLLTGSFDKTARLWDVATGKSVGPPLEHPDRVLDVAFHPKGGVMLTGCSDGTAHRWELPVPVTGVVTGIKRWVEGLTGMQMDDRGSVRELEKGALRKVE